MKIFIIILLVTSACIFMASCKDQAPETEYGEVWLNCDCGNKHFGGTYIKPYYWFECGICKKVFTNTDCNTVDEFYIFSGNPQLAGK